MRTSFIIAVVLAAGGLLAVVGWTGWLLGRAHERTATGGAAFHLLQDVGKRLADADPELPGDLRALLNEMDEANRDGGNGAAMTRWLQRRP